MSGQKRKFSEVSSASSSLLQSSETSFPRGGASSLTPLELKEVANEAARDVLFEAVNGKENAENVSISKETPKNKKKRFENKKSKNIENGDEDDSDEKIYIEHLNSKNLVPGNLVLGQVLEITKHFISLSLPDNLVGFVHLSNISDEVSQKIQTYEDTIDEDKEDDEGVDEEEEEEINEKTVLPHPNDFIKIGQWLRAIVVETTQRNSNMTKKQLNKAVELSIVPALVNKTLQTDLDFVLGQTIQASVKSVEDHGLVLNIGKDEDMSGFISKKEFTNSDYSFDQVKEGSVFLFIMNRKMTNSKRVVTLSLDFSGLSKKKMHHSVDTISSIDAVIPGNIVESVVIKDSEKGVACKIFGTIKGCLTLPNSTIYTVEGLKSKFKVGEKFKAKVEASIVVEGDKQLLLTLLPHVLSLKKTPYLNSFKPLEAFPIGLLLEKVTVKAFDGIYLYVELGSGSILGRVHVSKITDSKTVKPGILNSKFYSGSTHKAKILGYSNFDNQYVLSMEPQILAQKYIRAQDIPVGEFFIGVVEKVSGSEGMILKAFDAFSIFIPAKHISDVKLVYPERKYKIGSKVKGRVLSVNHKNKIIATLKKSLVNLSDRKEIENDDERNIILSSYNDIKVGDRSAGTVEAILANGAIISFFGGVNGFLPKSEISEAFVRHPQDFLKLGQSVAIKVLMVDPVTKKMTVSCKSKSSPKSKDEKSSNSLDSLKCGRSFLKTIIVEKTSENLILESNGIRAILDSSHLSDNNYEQNRQAFKALKTGDELEVLVLDKDKKAQLAIVTAKQSMIEDAKNDKLPLNFKDVSSLGSSVEIHGYIRSITDKGLFVGFSGKLVGLLLKKYASKNRDAELDQLFKKNQSITCHVIRKDEENERFLLSLDVSKEKKSKHQITEDDTKFKVQVGKVVPGKIITIRDNYLIIKLVQKKVGYCHITDALVDYDKTLHETYKIGKIVNADILSYDSQFKRYAVSLRNNLSDNIVDKAINSIEDLAVGDIVRGFVKNINEKGVYVSLSNEIYALVRVSDLFDDFVKNWKSKFKVNQLVKGRIISVKGEGRILLTMKESLMIGKLNLAKSFDDLEVGDIFEGSVKSVTDYGVFVKLDGTNNITGLSHRSQISDDGVVENLGALFGEGDKVKVKVLSIDTKKKQLSLGMKASYFVDNDEDEDSAMKEVEYEQESDDEDSDKELLEEAYNDDDDENHDNDEEDHDESEDVQMTGPEFSESGLSTNGFDWTASILDQVDNESEEDDDYETEMNGRKKNKKTKNQIVEDKTYELNNRAPQSAADFERLLIGEPNSSILWMNYMSFQIQLSEIQKAREIGERALKTINYREEQEKLNIWIAMLNLENSFGSEESLQAVFKKSIQYMDSLTMYQKLVGIYILSEKVNDAEALFKVMIKKFNDEISVWFSFGKFYMDNKKFDEAHELLAKALKSLPLTDHIEIVKKFAQLEFSIGDAEQARSLFEGLIADKPKRFDLWNVYIDQEIKKKEKQKVEDLFERLVVKKLSNKQKKFFFFKWLTFEENMGDNKACDYVKAKAKDIANISSK